MNNYQANLFVSLSNTNSFSKTAKIFVTNYQNVIYQIDKLEEEFDTKFFDRTKKGCTLTQTGIIFKSFVENYLCQYDTAKEKIHKANDNIIFGVNYYIIQPVISIYYNRYLDDKIIYSPMKYTNLYSALKEGEISCFIGCEKNGTKVYTTNHLQRIV